MEHSVASHVVVNLHNGKPISAPWFGPLSSTFLPFSKGGSPGSFAAMRAQLAQRDDPGRSAAIHTPGALLVEHLLDTVQATAKLPVLGLQLGDLFLEFFTNRASETVHEIRHRVIDLAPLVECRVRCH